MRAYPQLIDNELAFISGKYLEEDLPKEQSYLLKYFRSETQVAFLKYYLMFEGYVRFVEHTGYSASWKWMELLKQKLQVLQAAHKKAKDEMDLETLATIETGKYKLRLRKRTP